MNEFHRSFGQIEPLERELRDAGMQPIFENNAGIVFERGEFDNQSPEVAKTIERYGVSTVAFAHRLLILKHDPGEGADDEDRPTADDTTRVNEVLFKGLDDAE